MAKALSVISYPGVLIVAIALHLYAVNTQSLIIATYLPVLFAVLIISLLEYFTPERTTWSPNSAEVGNDAAFMIAIQVLLPRMLAFVFVLMLVDPLRAAGLVLESYWPHQWQIGLQVIIMILVADFFRYWLHRFAHEYGFLWRFHAVHHSVSKLYWLNVGRFHYVDKFLQFLFDALPFMILGVSENVIALYFVFYSINGFFQHSNIRLRLGFLNYIISTAELHRWHHSCITKESNTNYGNNIIIWDLLFGTWFLPKDRDAVELGLHNKKYPTSFIDQLKTPFIDGINEHDTILPGYGEVLRNWLIKIGMVYNRIFLWAPLDRASFNPEQVQATLLQRILYEYKATHFGQKYGFESIVDYETYKQRVPVQTYEDLRPFIEKQLSQGTIELTPTMPCMYAVSSGTTGQPKMLPILKETLRQQRRAQRIFSYLQYRQAPDAFNGKLLGIMGAPVEGRLNNGVPYGAVSGMLYLNMPVILHSKYVIPAMVFEIPDYELKYLLILRLAMAEPDITYMSGANPSTFLKLQTLMSLYGQQLIDDIKSGGFFRKKELDELLVNQLKAAPDRAAQLQRVLDHSSLSYANVWPHLRLLATWTGGSCGVVLGQLKNYISEQTRIADLGYIASEFRGTIPVDLNDSSGIPLLHDNFYEFVIKDDWESGKLSFLLLDQLKEGMDYYIFITTCSGLFRYQMDDIIRVTGFYKKTPLLRFIQKGKGITSITGEKLYENQVLDAVNATCDELNINLPFFIMLADKENAGYEIYLESGELDEVFSEILDKKLAAINLEYEAKRKSGRLIVIQSYLLKPGTGEAYKQYMVQRGQREGQYKPVLLLYKDELEFPVAGYCLK